MSRRQHFTEILPILKLLHSSSFCVFCDIPWALVMVVVVVIEVVVVMLVVVMVVMVVIIWTSLLLSALWSVLLLSIECYQHKKKLLWSKFHIISSILIIFFLFYVYGCFICMYLGTPTGCLVPMEVRGGATFTETVESQDRPWESYSFMRTLSGQGGWI